MKDEDNDFDAMFEDEQGETPAVEDKSEPVEAQAESPQEAQTPETEPLEAKSEESNPEAPEPEQEPITEPDADNNGAAFKAVRESAAEKARAEADRIWSERVANLEGQVAQLSQNSLPKQAQPAPQEIQEEIPDIILDPEGYRNWEKQQRDQALNDTKYELRMEMSYERELAAGKTDAELRAEAQPFIEAAKANPQLAEQLKSQSNPVRFIREWTAKQQLNQELAAHGGSLEALIEAKVQERQAAATPQPVTTAPAQAQPAPTIPQSIVDVRPATEIAGAKTNDLDDFEAIFS